MKPKTTPRPRRRGRRKSGGGDARAAVLDAARKLFATHGFRGTTMRAVATRAHVDQALVHYFFQSKAKLFAAAIAVPDTSATLGDELRGVENAGERMLRVHLEGLFVDRRESIAAMLRAALGDASALPALRSFLEDSVVSDLARVLRGKDARLRSELAGAFMVGLFVVRHMVGLEPLRSASADDIVEAAAPALDALLGSVRRGARS